MSRFLILSLACLLVGCAPAYNFEAEESGDSPVINRFDASSSSSITGQVCWEGPLPTILPLRGSVSPRVMNPPGPPRDWPNPNAPRVSPMGGGLADAVVYLRGVDPHNARPWDHGAVTVELENFQLRIMQKEKANRIGLVRRGDRIAILCRQPDYLILRGRGADFFGIPLVEQNREQFRLLNKVGLVELSSGTGQFWMRGHLFVSDHPYLAVTAADGTFTIPLVPPGTYEVVCWHPHWLVAGYERDADSAMINRLTFHPPVERVRTVTVEKGQSQVVPFTFSLDQFQR